MRHVFSAVLTLLLASCGPPNDTRQTFDINSNSRDYCSGADGTTCARPNREEGVCVRHHCKHTPDCEERGPDWCSGKPDSEHCHTDRSSQNGFCHDGRCLNADNDGNPICDPDDCEHDERQCPPDASPPPPPVPDAAVTPDAPIVTPDASVPTPDAAVSVDAPVQSTPDAAVSIDAPVSTPDAAPVPDAAVTPDAAPVGFCGDGVCDSTLGETCDVCVADCGTCPAGTGGSGGSQTPPDLGHGTDGRVGWGCSVGSTTEKTETWGAMILFLIAMITALFFGKRKLALGMLVGCALLWSASAFAQEERSGIHAEVSAVHQIYPGDVNKFDSETARRTGVEVGLSVDLTSYLAGGVHFTLGEYTGVRVVADLHTDYTARKVNLLLEPRFIVHPVPNDVGIGLGGFVGATYELGPGRLFAGPAIETYTAPNGGKFHDYAVLGYVGYQFDLPGEKKPVVSKPVQTQPKVQDAVDARPVPTPPPQEVEVHTYSADFLFDFDSAVLKAEGKALLNELIMAYDVKSDAITKIEVVGHTCAIGSEAYNQKLSERRANAVADYLVAGGIPRSLITTSGKGKTAPVADNSTKAGRKKNRRVEIYVYVKEE